MKSKFVIVLLNAGKLDKLLTSSDKLFQQVTDRYANVDNNKTEAFSGFCINGVDRRKETGGT